MKTLIRVLDVVALTEDLPDRDLRRGQVGTVVEALAPGVFEVEFSDNEGRTYASLALRAEQLLVLIPRRVYKEMHQRAVGGTDRSRCGVKRIHCGMNQLHCSVNGFGVE